MARFLAGAAACFLLLTGAFLFWQSRAAQAPLLPEAPPARMATPALVAQSPLPEPPEATPKSREEKRFSRADKDKNGRFDHIHVIADQYVAGPYAEGPYEIPLPITAAMIERLKADYRASFEPRPPVK